MPRILPRLIKALETNPLQPIHIPFNVNAFRRKPKSLHKPLPPTPPFRANRARSILLDQPNPINNSKLYTRHKSLPPAVRVARNTKSKVGEFDKPRQMTEEERAWGSSPYLRLLSSPIRLCIVSNRHLPTAFLVRLAPVRLPGHTPSKTETTLIPDGLQHPKFATSKRGRAVYIHCSRNAVAQMYERDRHKRAAPNMMEHPRLADHIAHLLRVRILQEFRLLLQQLSAPHFVYPPNSARILRRLTRKQWKNLRETNIIPYEDAVAVLVVPPVNRDPVSKVIVNGTLTAEPLPPDPRTNLRPLPPLSVFSQLAPNTEDVPTEEPDLPHANIPLYNGLALFPAAQQRTVLHSLLRKIDGADSRVCRDNVKQRPANSDDRWSHVYVLCSSPQALLHADTVPAAVAMWRLRMFENRTESNAESNA